MNHEIPVRTIVAVILTCVVINGVFYLVQVHEHHRLLQTASTGFRSRRALGLPLKDNIEQGVADPARTIKQENQTAPAMSREVLHIDKNKLFVVAKAIPLGTHPCTVHAPQEEQLVEVSRNLLMLGDQPNAQQWKAREQAYRNRLLAVTLDGATKHHMYGMSRKLFALDVAEAKWTSSQIINNPALPLDDTDAATSKPGCHNDPECKALHSTAMVQLEFAFQTADQTRCGMDAGRKAHKHSLACVQGSAGAAKHIVKAIPWWHMVWVSGTTQDGAIEDKGMEHKGIEHKGIENKADTSMRAPVHHAAVVTMPVPTTVKCAPPTVPSVTPALRAPATNHSTTAVCKQPPPAAALHLAIHQPMFGPPNAHAFPANLTWNKNVSGQGTQPLNTLPPKPRHGIAREAGNMLRVASGAVGKRALLQRLRGGNLGA